MSVSMFILKTPYETASAIFAGSEPEPPWKTKWRFAPVEWVSCERLAVPKNLGTQLTLPGL